MLRELCAYVRVIYILTKGYLSPKAYCSSVICDIQSHRAPKVPVFLELTHVLSSFPRTSGHADKAL